MLRVFKILKNTKVEGPQNRYCIWVQGCSRHCIGCQAPHTWSHNGGTLYKEEDIVQDILLSKNLYNIEGVTFLGGEPFEQAKSLGVIAEAVRDKNLGVLCFTGNYIEELQINDNYKKLLENTDLLIDGPFEIDKADYSRPWCGSCNQRYHFLTNRYNEEIFKKYTNKIEINIQKNGVVFMNGMGDFEKIQQKMELQKII